MMYKEEMPGELFLFTLLKKRSMGGSSASWWECIEKTARLILDGTVE